GHASKGARHVYEGAQHAYEAAGHAYEGSMHAAPLHIPRVLIVRIAIGLVLAYLVLLVLAWLFQERLAFPAPRAPLPDPTRVGVADGEKIELVTKDGTRLAGWYLTPITVGAQHAAPLHGAEQRGDAPALLWFYGNGENIATIWPIVHEFQPPGAALLVVDYPGYGGRGGRATAAGMYGGAGAAH